MPEELRLRVDAAATASDAMQIGRLPGLLDSARQVFASARGGMAITPVVRFDETIARQGPERLRPLIDVPALDTGIEFRDGHVEVLEASPGISLDVDAAVAFVSADPQTVL